MNEEVDPRVESAGAHSTALMPRSLFSRFTTAPSIRIRIATPVTALFGFQWLRSVPILNDRDFDAIGTSSREAASPFPTTRYRHRLLLRIRSQRRISQTTKRGGTIIRGGIWWRSGIENCGRANWAVGQSECRAVITSQTPNDITSETFCSGKPPRVVEYYRD